MNHPPDEELESLLAAYSETQDQLLAVFALTQATQNVFDLKEILRLLMAETRNLLKAKSLFFFVENEEGQTEFVAYPPEHIRPAELYPQLVQLSVEVHAQQLSPCYMLDICPIKSPYLVCTSPPHLPETLCRGLVHPFYVYVRQFKNGGRMYLGFSTDTLSEEVHPLLRLGELIAAQATTQIANIFLHAQIVAKTRLETEMQLAQDVQTRLLPRTVPDLSALGLETSVYFHPASLIGGDFYDFTQTSDTAFAFAVGDISGKGIPAALLMVMVLTALRSKTNSEHCYDPGEILTRINQELYPEFIRTGGFATVFYARFDTESHIIELVNAGHSPVVYCPVEGGARLIGPDGPPVGVLPTRNYQCKRLHLHPGDVLVAGTDGFSEAHNPAQALFGTDRFIQAVEQMRTESAETIKDHLVAQTRTFAAGHPQSDDQTLVVLKCCYTPENTARL